MKVQPNAKLPSKQPREGAEGDAESAKKDEGKPVKLEPANLEIAIGIQDAGDEELGRGATGLVKLWRGRINDRPEQYLAVKMVRVDVITQEVFDDKSRLEKWKHIFHSQFRNEAKYLMQFRRNNNILNCEGLEVHPDGLNMTLKLERLSGSLSDLSLTGAGGFQLLASMVDAIEDLRTHGLVHRDIKPDNIGYILTEQETYQFKLIDFGMAEPWSRGPKYGGTEFYRAPEFLVGSYGYTSDCYSLFITVAHACRVGVEAYNACFEEDDERGYFSRVIDLEREDDSMADWADMKAFCVEARASSALIKRRIQFIEEHLPSKYHVIGLTADEREERDWDVAVAVCAELRRGKMQDYKQMLGPMASQLEPHLHRLQAEDRRRERLERARGRGKAGYYPSKLPSSAVQMRM